MLYCRLRGAGKADGLVRMPARPPSSFLPTCIDGTPLQFQAVAPPLRDMYVRIILQVHIQSRQD